MRVAVHPRELKDLTFSQDYQLQEVGSRSHPLQVISEVANLQLFLQEWVVDESSGASSRIEAIGGRTLDREQL